jgi:hypothetical protein
VQPPHAAGVQTLACALTRARWVRRLEEKTNEFFKHDTDGDNAISFAEFQK